jgi:hypothetical protein
VRPSIAEQMRTDVEPRINFASGIRKEEVQQMMMLAFCDAINQTTL